MRKSGCLPSSPTLGRLTNISRRKPSLTKTSVLPKDISSSCLSSIYGLLRPLDAIHPYRMEGKVKLEAAGGKNLFAFWKQYLTDMLIEAVKADDGILVHLATEEFEHLFDWKRVCQEVKVVQPLFYVDKGDTIKVVSVYAKSCRGAMTRYIIQRRITRLTDMLSFESEGFRYDSRYGDELHPHFIRK